MCVAKTLLFVLFINLANLVSSQSNYAEQINSVEFPNEGLPDSTILDGKVTKLDDLAPVIFLNRTKAALNCAAGYMQVCKQTIYKILEKLLTLW